MTQVKSAARVLVVDDELLQRRIVSEQLLQMNFDCDSAATAAKALELLQEQEFDVVLLDVQMGDVSGLELLPRIKSLEDPPEVIMLTLDSSLESGIAAMRDGAYDYLTKPAGLSRLEMTVRKAAEKRRLVRQNSSLRDFVEKRRAGDPEFCEPVSQSSAMNAVIEQANAVTGLVSTVLITGESGTGKDVLARYIHSRSPRARSAMVTVNCGAIPENLFESEFFGYEKGAFSGANATKRGLIEVADGATLFLDEIGELPLALQVKLLRFLESGEFRRVGGTRNLFSDARLIAATNQDLQTAVRENRFRSDLYYRLNVIEIHIPPLRERREDLEALIDFHLELYRSRFQKPKLEFTPEARRKLESYDFPGNVRELKNIIERAAALASGERIEASGIYFQSSTVETNGKSLSDAAPKPAFPADFQLSFDIATENTIVKMDDLERRYILSVLNFTAGNRERAATLLGISERTLYRRLREYE